MRKTLVILLYIFIILLISSTIHADNLYSTMDGSWSSRASWSRIGAGGPTCNCTPSTHDFVIISHNITFDTDLDIGLGGYPDSLRINPGGSLNSDTADLSVSPTGNMKLMGILRARDITFYNGSNVDITLGGTLQATRDLTNRNNSKQIRVAGTIRVDGNFEAGQGSIISGTGSLFVTGTSTFEGDGIAFGCQEECCPTGTKCTYQFGALPVSWLGVQVRSEGEEIMISWQTASEENNSYFTIERSTNGFSFQAIGQIGGSGTRLIQASYSFRDAFPPSGTLYYRIRQTDYNGDFSYSPVTSLRGLPASHQQQFGVYPNPCSADGSITCNAAWIQPDTEYSVNLLDAQGRQATSISIVSGTIGSLIIPAGSLGRPLAGVYYLRLNSGNSIGTSKFIIY